MTFVELVETCGHISLITATVRGTKQSEFERVCEYRIGARAQYFRCDYRGQSKQDPKVHIIKKPIHVRDDGAPNYSYGQVMKNIPIKLRKLEVMSWSCGTEYVQGWWGDYPCHLRCDLRSGEYAGGSKLNSSEARKR